MIAGYEGDAATVEHSRAVAVRAALRGRRHPARRGGRRGLVRRPLPRPLPPRLDARRRRARGDAGDGDVLVQACRRSTPRSRPPWPVRWTAPRRWCCATSRTSTRPEPRSTSPSPPGRRPTALEQWARAKAAASDAIDRGRRDDHPPPRGRPRPPAVARAEIGPVGVGDAACRQGTARPAGRAQPRRAGAVRPASACGLTARVRAAARRGPRRRRRPSHLRRPRR